MTFSIVAWDPHADPHPEWGVAVASKFLAVGAVVGWARSGAGALATQALANLAYGPDGIALLSAGHSAHDVVSELTSIDEQREHRQLGVVDSDGRAESFTGSECFEWAGHLVEEGFCCQGNILAGPLVIEAMAESFAQAHGDLAERLVSALAAGDDAGGDRRGRQSASVLVVRQGGGYGGGIDKAVDLRVDDHPQPVEELKRLLDLQRLYFPRPDDLQFIDIDQSLAAELRQLLVGAGYDVASGQGYDDALKEALFSYVGIENLEERWVDEPRIERAVLEYVRTNLRK